ncbi:MAG: hypothetical protein CME64_11820 [Halobacteriovoraceae bacterium]|nr:hypothetical protein [Halobacteriovoraceae bacterium]|tara:strand:+ start:26136 stop:26801 length:666 start_codon:yes stop_codon:yes gene_type:complete
MKIALLGTGKTGMKVADIHGDVELFNTRNPATLDSLKNCDVVVSFLPGEAFLDHIDLLVESGLPVVTGSTGMEWPKNIEQRLKENNASWIKAHNFSLGMNVVREMIKTMSKLSDLFDDGTFTIHDIHHVHKKDAPSGTAISWKEWLGKDAEITAQREGDVVGYHHLEFDCADEKIKLVHEAKDRTIFARGAVWAAKILHEDHNLSKGLLDFNEVVKNYLKL